jgi:superfamily II DNA or RNA helicase
MRDTGTVLESGTLRSSDRQSVIAERRRTIRLRSYQAEAVEAADTAFSSGVRKGLIVLPTGAGKTVVFGKLAQRRLDRRVIILAHREELISQARDKIASITGIEPSIEQGKKRAKAHDRVVVASIPSLAQGRKIEGPRFGLAVVDEAHHGGAPSYRSVLSSLRPTHVLGVTATPDRADSFKLSRIFGKRLYSKTLLDLIQAGYLSDIRVRALPISVDISGVRTEMNDYREGDLGLAVEPVLERLADIIATEYRDRKCLTFCPLRATSTRWTELLKARGLPAAHVDGDSRDREAILRAYANNEIRFLSNAALLTEGYDEPSIDTILNLRPTTSRTLFSQIVGRGTRLYPGKKHLLLLDPLFQAERTNPIGIGDIVAETEIEARRIDEAMREGTKLSMAAKTPVRATPAKRNTASAVRGLVNVMEESAHRSGYEKPLAEVAAPQSSLRKIPLPQSGWSLIQTFARLFSRKKA